MTENFVNELNSKDLRFYAQQFSAYNQSGTPIGIKDRKLSRKVADDGPTRRSKASSRTIRRAVERQRKKDKKDRHSKGFL